MTSYLYLDQSLSSPLATMMATQSGGDGTTTTNAYSVGEPLFFGETSSECSRTSSPPPLCATHDAPPLTPPLQLHQQLQQHHKQQQEPNEKAPVRRRRKTAQTPKALALKRARRSEIERNSRLRRLDELSRMREQLLRLEYEYKRLADGEGLETLVFETDPVASVQIVAAKTHIEKSRLHRRLAFMTQLLHEEQNQLRKLMQEHDVFQATVHSAWRCELSSGDDVKTSPSLLPLDPELETTTREWVHPARCFAYLRETYEHIFSFDASHEYESTGASIMGWTDKRRVDHTTGHLQYGFRKTFLGQRAELLLTKSWDILRDASKMWKLLVDPKVTTKYTTLQVLNDDLTLIRRDHTHPPLPLTFLTVHVLFRLQTPQGFLLCFRTMPIPEIQDKLAPHEIWFDVLNWTLFNHVHDAQGNITGCEVIVGGSLGDPSQVTTKHWLFELIISVLRWESICVAPLFLMASES